MKKIICLWGGPGTGKSTTCAGVFNMLKKLGYNAEMNREYVKDWVWEGRDITDGDQVYITCKQLRKERIYIQNNLDFIVTDSPAALSVFYGQLYDKYERNNQACRDIVRQHHELCKDKGYKVEHYFLRRMKEYQQAGRREDEKTAREFDDRIKQFLKDYPINFKELICDKDVEHIIVQDLVGYDKYKTYEW